MQLSIQQSHGNSAYITLHIKVPHQTSETGKTCGSVDTSKTAELMDLNTIDDYIPCFYKSPLLLRNVETSVETFQAAGGGLGTFLRTLLMFTVI